MVIDEGHQMLTPINAPLVRAKLTMQGVGDLKQIHRIKAGIDTLVAFVVSAAMQHLIINDQIIIPEQDLADQYEITL